MSNELVESILQLGRLEKDWLETFFNIKNNIRDFNNFPPCIKELRDDLIIQLEKIITTLMHSFRESREKTFENYEKEKGNDK